MATSKSTKVARICERCGVEFLAKAHRVTPARIKEGRGRFCTARCARHAYLGPPLLVKFNKRVDPTPTERGCLLWIGSTDAVGYGHLSRGKNECRSSIAHRLAWELANGPIPEGLDVCHKCDVYNCVNVDHLFLGTHADNMRDMAIKERSYGTKLTADQVKEIRARHATGTAHIDLAIEFGVGRGATYAIVHRKTWKHVD